MRQMINIRKNIARKNKYKNRYQNYNQDNKNIRNVSGFAQTIKRRCLCCGYKYNMLDTFPMKYDVEKLSSYNEPIKRSHTYRQLKTRRIL